MHVSNFTQPDVAFAVSYLARFVNALTTDKVARVLDVIKYLNGTCSYGLYLGGRAEHCPIYVHCDADWTACLKTRRSLTGFFVKCGLGAIAWKAARHATVSRSTTESEYIDAGEIAEELQYVHQLAPQFELASSCIPVGYDNNAAISFMKYPITAART
jgi:hypothetical protein